METTWTPMNKISRLLGIWWEKHHDCIISFTFTNFMCVERTCTFVNGMWLFAFGFSFLWQIKIYCWGSVLKCWVKLFHENSQVFISMDMNLKSQIISWFSNRIMLVSFRSKEGITFIVMLGVLQPLKPR